MPLGGTNYVLPLYTYTANPTIANTADNKFPDIKK